MHEVMIKAHNYLVVCFSFFELSKYYATETIHIAPSRLERETVSTRFYLNLQFRVSLPLCMIQLGHNESPL